MTNSLSRGRWQTRHKNALKWKALVALAVAMIRPEKPFNKAMLKLTRFSSKRPDYDGIVSGFKHIIDGLVEAQVLKNDTFEVIGNPLYDWGKAKYKQGYVLIEVEEIESQSTPLAGN